MRSFLSAITLILLFQTYVCPQDIISDAKVSGSDPFSLSKEEQLLLHTKSPDGRGLNKSQNDFIRKLGKSKATIKPTGNIFLPHIALIDSTRRFIYTWDETGSQKVELCQELKEGVWNYVSRKTYFTENGRQVSYVSEQWKNGAWVNSERVTETYQDNYTRRVLVSERWENNLWVPQSRHTSTYDSNDNTLTYLWENYKNGKWTNVSRYNCVYDASGNLLVFIQESWENGMWVNKLKSTQSYNDQNKLLTSVFQNWQDGLWMNFYRTNSTYDINGNELSFLWEDWRDGAWLKNNRITRTFDNKNRELTWLLEYWINGAWINRSKLNNMYSVNSDTLISLVHYWSQGTWVISDRTIQTYNSKGFPLTSLVEVRKDTSWVNAEMQRFHYDYFGNTEKGESFFWKDGAWRPLGRDLKFNYNNGKDQTSFMGATVQVAYNVLVDESPSVAQEFELSQNYPNPFNSSTSIVFTMRKTAPVRISVYDILGNRVAVL
ncbi:MAG: hypothetical protein ACM3P0_10275, partial [Acidobacteriota bacterium]